MSSTYLFGLSSCGVKQEDPDQGMAGLGRVVQYILCDMRPECSLFTVYDLVAACTD